MLPKKILSQNWLDDLTSKAVVNMHWATILFIHPQPPPITNFFDILFTQNCFFIVGFGCWQIKSHSIMW